MPHDDKDGVGRDGGADGIGANNTRIPPSAHAMSELARCARKPFPSQETNFTVRDKLLAFGYAELEWRPSPYKTHKPGTQVPYLVLTPSGAAVLAERALSARKEPQ